MLPRKRYPDDGDKQDSAHDEMTRSEPDTTAKDPENIENEAQHPGVGRCVYHFLTKRGQHRWRQLKKLQPERNTDDREAEYKATESVAQAGEQSAK